MLEKIFSEARPKQDTEDILHSFTPKPIPTLALALALPRTPIQKSPNQSLRFNLIPERQVLMHIFQLPIKPLNIPYQFLNPYQIDPKVIILPQFIARLDIVTHHGVFQNINLIVAINNYFVNNLFVLSKTYFPNISSRMFCRCKVFIYIC